jgi:hypothetical protein
MIDVTSWANNASGSTASCLPGDPQAARMTKKMKVRFRIMLIQRYCPLKRNVTKSKKPSLNLSKKYSIE